MWMFYGERLIMVSLGVWSPPSPRKSPLPPHMPSHQPFQSTRFSPSPSFRRSHKIVEGGRNYMKIPLFTGEEDHVDTYMVMKTTKNKIRIKYPKEISKKWKSQFLIMFGKGKLKKRKKDFFTIQPVIEYLFERGSLRL